MFKCPPYVIVQWCKKELGRFTHLMFLWSSTLQLYCWGLTSSLVVWLEVTRYVWNPASPSIDHTEKKHITASIILTGDSFIASKNSNSSFVTKIEEIVLMTPLSLSVPCIVLSYSFQAEIWSGKWVGSLGQFVEIPLLNFLTFGCYIYSG